MYVSAYKSKESANLAYYFCGILEILTANYGIVDFYLNVTHVFSIQGLVNLNAVLHTARISP